MEKLLIKSLLAEFEKRYHGDAGQSESICQQIAKERNLDPDYVADIIYINRYQEEEEEETLEED